MSEKYCQALGLDDILYCFYVTTQQNSYVFTQKTVLYSLSIQPTLKLVWCLLYSNKTS